ncbi:MAG: hypothetical protein M3R44_08005 [Candidatus Eremiobacteraeota bacterium]|nr:hypothetical protein [Candidatus Eremiobacteraeota bacterium]
MIRALGGIAVATALGAAFIGSAAHAAACAASRGEHVVLSSEAVDPDVFVWDSRDRLVTYAAGQWRDTRAIFAHTMLAEPGTEAALTCSRHAVRASSLPGGSNPLGVLVLSGRYRGRYGWVLSSDVHFSAHPSTHSALSKRS